MATLIPDYLSLDFSTIIERIKSQLADSTTFADYNYEGANITILMELLAYIGELNTYLLNKIAQNVHIETADVYEAVNRNARQMGYEPKGPISARGSITMAVTGATPSEEYKLYEFTQLTSDAIFDGENILYTNTTTYSITPTGDSFFEEIDVRQGEIVQLDNYSGKDLIDNELILPENFAYDNDLADDLPSLVLFVNGEAWDRISNFYDDLSPLRQANDVYMFVYDRYKRSKIVFNSARNVPTNDDTITLKVLRTLGDSGSVGANQIVNIPDQFLYNVPTDTWVDNSTITVTNDTTTTGGADAEATDSIKENARASLLSQYRNVANVDYQSNLEERDDVVQANAWGEQDLSPSGAIQEFNKVHLSVIPNEYGSGTIGTIPTIWTTDWGVSGVAPAASGYNGDYEQDLATWIEPRKMVTTYEVFQVPNLIYFSFEFGLRRKRLYNFDTMQTDLKNKLIYYFRAANQDFSSIIDWKDILEYLIDPTEISDEDNFDSIKGIRNLTIRDLDIQQSVYEPNNDGDYPQWVSTSASMAGNVKKKKKIQLGLNHFPVLQSSTVTIGQNTGIWANGGVYTILYAKNDEGSYVGHRFIIQDILGNNFKFGYHGRETVHDQATELEVGEEMYFRKDSFFHDWLKNNSTEDSDPNYQDFVNPDKQHLYFGPILSISGLPTTYNIEFYGMKDWVMDALPEHNRTEKLTEFMEIYWDKINQEVYNMTKTLWSLIDPREVNIKHIDYLATRAKVSTDKDKFGGDELRTWIDNLLFWLKRKGTYTAYMIVGQMLLNNTRNKINMFEQWCEWCLRELRRSGNYLLPDDFTEHHVIEYYSPSAGILPSGGAGDEYYEQFRLLDYPTHTDVAPVEGCEASRYNCGDMIDYIGFSTDVADDLPVLTIDNYSMDIDGWDPATGTYMHLFGEATLDPTDNGGEFRHCVKTYMDSSSTPSGGIMVWGASDDGDMTFTSGEPVGSKEWLGVSMERHAGDGPVVYRLWQETGGATTMEETVEAFDVDTPYFLIIEYDGSDIYLDIYNTSAHKSNERVEALVLPLAGTHIAKSDYAYIYGVNYRRTANGATAADGGGQPACSFKGEVANLRESAGSVATIGPTGYPVITPHYRVELDLSTEPIGEDEIISQDLAEELTRYWDYIKPVSRFVRYNFLLSPIGRVDDIGQAVPLYLPDAQGICDTTFIGAIVLSAGEPVLKGNNLIPNPDMEQTTGWSDVAAPTTQERSNDYARSGSFSRKFTSSAVGDGIQSNTFITETGKVYNYELFSRGDTWIAPSGSIQIRIRNGDGSGWAEDYTPTNITHRVDKWTRIQGSYYEDGGGSGAYIQMLCPDGTGPVSEGFIGDTWYVDDVSVLRNPIGDTTHYHRQLVGSPTWKILHGLTDQIITQTYDRVNQLVWPQYHDPTIDGTNGDTLRVDFNDATRGKAFTAGLKSWNKQHVQSAPASGWTITHNMGLSGSEGVIVEVLTDVPPIRNIFPEDIQQVNTNTLQLRFPEPVTGRAFMRDDDYVHTQTETSLIWNVRHNLDTAGTLINCYDTNGYMLSPEDITLIDTDHSTVTFCEAVAGTAVVVGFRKTGDVGDEQVNDAFSDINTNVAGYWKVGDGSSDVFDPTLHNDLSNTTVSGGLDTRTETATGASGSILINFEVPGWPRGDAYTINEMGIFDKNKNLQYYTKCSTLHKPDDVALNVRYRIRKSGFNSEAE